MITIQVKWVPRRQADAPGQLDLPAGSTVMAALKQLNVARQGVMTSVDDAIVDEAFIIENPCTLTIISAVSGG